MTSHRLCTSSYCAALLLLAACAEGAGAHGETKAAAADTAAAAVAPVESTHTSQADGAIATAIRYTVASTGNVARYRVREQLVGRDLPNDAIGETAQVTGGITLDDSGAVVASESRFVVATGAFKSDSDRRDGYVRRRLLEAEQFPTVELVPAALGGLPATLLASTNAAGPVTFTLTGDLTVRGVTRPTTWTVTARKVGTTVTGTARTQFTFNDFSLTQPRVRVVLSVADTIGLEYDFTLIRGDAEEP